MMIELTREMIENYALVPATSNPRCGATVVFLGTARKLTDGRQTTSLEYDAYEAMAEKVLRSLETEALARWPLVDIRIVHRLGQVALGETCVAVVVSAPHRRDAFDSASWLMDQVKRHVPIWKQEHWADGSSQWIHPTNLVPGTRPDEAGQ